MAFESVDNKVTEQIRKNMDGDKKIMTHVKIDGRLVLVTTENSDETYAIPADEVKNLIAGLY